MPPKPPKPKIAFPQPAAVLPGEADILASVVADLSDDTAKLVYADWLEDRDDKRGPLLRKSVAAFRAGKKLPPAKTTPEPWLDLVGITLMGKILAAKMTAHADKILRLARPAIVVTSSRAAEAKLPVGASKFGGGPDMPPGADWPCYGEMPLAFLAQFNLAELHASFVVRELPKSGLLSVFVVLDEDDTGAMGDKGSWRVLHFPDVSKLTRQLPPETSFNSCRVSFAETMTVPDSRSPWQKELGLDEDEEVWDAYQEQVAGYGQGHTILGYPTPIQNDVLGKKTMRHLLTLGGDDNAEWEWFDGGSLYFTMTEADLKAGRFDRVRFEMQCG
jgi:uncharacterized protein (TIGR02996 family)